MKLAINTFLCLMVCTITTMHSAKLPPKPEEPANQVAARGPFTNGNRRIAECVSKELEAIENATLNEFRGVEGRHPNLDNPSDFSKLLEMRRVIRAGVDHDQRVRNHVIRCYNLYHQRQHKLPLITTRHNFKIVQEVTPRSRSISLHIAPE